MPTLAIANQKGGTGKTTVALALALYAARHGVSTFAADLDIQGNLTTGLGQDAESTLAAWLTTKRGSAFIQVEENLVLAPGGLETAILERGLDPQKHTTLLSRKLQEVPAALKVLDCPPNMGIMTMMAIYGADYVLIPTQLEPASVEGVHRMLEALTAMRSTWGRSANVMGIVPNMVRDIQLHTIFREALRAKFGRYYPGRGYQGSVWEDLTLTAQVSRGKNPWQSLTQPFKGQWEWMCERVLHYEEEKRTR